MYQGSPFETPAGLSGRVEGDVGGALEWRSRDGIPELSSKGWCRFAATAFAISPAIVFLLVVLFSSLTHA